MTMIALEQARQHLEALGLKQAVEALDNTLDAAASKQLTYADVLAQLLGLEVSARRERYHAGNATTQGTLPRRERYHAGNATTQGTLPRRERYLTTKTRMAHLPFLRTLEQFDFDFQPSIDERQSLPPCRRGARNWPTWPL